MSYLQFTVASLLLQLSLSVSYLTALELFPCFDPWEEHHLLLVSLAVPLNLLLCFALERLVSRTVSFSV